jgi:putative oxygen-independent coproporphyrinogen III oxidase
MLFASWSRIVLISDAKSLGVYVHWPFCLQICPYCDFNVYKNRAVDEARWRAAYQADLAAARVHRAGPVSSIFFGGGTPSLMSPNLVEQLLESIDQIFGLTPGVEITLEANPDRLGRAYLRQLAAAGVTRLSLGIQALDDAALKFLGRHHDAAGALVALNEVQDIFPSHSVDMIYARPQQTAAAWQTELERLLAYTPSHVSLYELTIEPDTSFGHRAARGDLAPLPGEQAADLYDLSGLIMAAHGLPIYEISNHARSGAECRHNVATWRGGDYIGIGPGAHGRISQAGHRHATEMPRDPAQWIKNADAPTYQWGRFDRLSPQEAAEELIFLGLRLVEGVAQETLKQAEVLGVAINWSEKQQLVSNGLLAETETHLRATSEGRKFLDYSLGRLLAS